MGTVQRGKTRAPLFACLLFGAVVLFFAACTNSSSFGSDPWSSRGPNAGPVDFTAQPLATPVFIPSAGSYSADQSVQISCATPGANLYYTVDGSTPTTASPLYSVPIPVTGSGTNKTIRVLAVKTGSTDATAAASFVINYSQVSTPQFSTPGGSYGADQDIVLSCSTPGATIYYETGSSLALTANPTTASPVYSTPIPVHGNPANVAIKVLAWKAGMADGIATAVFSINYPILTMAISGPGSGSTMPTVGMPIAIPAGIPYLVNATPATGSHIDPALILTTSGGASINLATFQVTLSSSGTVTAHFALNQYTLSPAVAGSGSMTPGVAMSADYGVPTLITATPIPGWHFTGWAGVGGATVDLPASPIAHATLWSDGSVTANFALDPVRLSAIASGGRIWSSSDGGISWFPGNSATMNWSTLTSSADGTKVVASAGAFGVDSLIYRSADGGLNWSPLSAPLLAYQGLGSSGDGSIIAASVYDGVNDLYYSTTSGLGWGSASIPGYQWWSTPSSSGDGLHWVMENGGDSSGNVKIFTGTFDGAASWNWTPTPFTAGGGSDYPSGYSVSKDGQKIFVTYAGHMHISTDFGASWNPISSTFTQISSSSMSGNGNTLAIVDHTSGNSRLYLSTDGGSTWIQSSTGLPAVTAPDSFSAPSISYDGSRIAVYTVLGGSGNLIYISTNGGLSFAAQTGPGASGVANWLGIHISQ